MFRVCGVGLGVPYVLVKCAAKISDQALSQHPRPPWGIGYGSL